MSMKKNIYLKEKMKYYRKNTGIASENGIN